MHHRTGSQININGPGCRCIDRKLRINRGIRANTHNYFPHHCVPEAVTLIEKHDSRSSVVASASLHLPSLFPPYLAPFHLPFSLSTPLFSVTRGLVGDEPMSAEDAERVGDIEERGGEEERRANERRYRTLTCFGLISSGCFVLKPLALIWGPQHLELIITYTPAAVLQLTVYTGYYIHSNTNFIQLMCWNLLLPRSLNCFIINLHKIQLHENVSIQLIMWGLPSGQDVGLADLSSDYTADLTYCTPLCSHLFLLYR